MSARVRPTAARPRSSAGSVVSRMNFAVENGWIMKPSATSPATSVMLRADAAEEDRGAGRTGSGPG